MSSRVPPFLPLYRGLILQAADRHHVPRVILGAVVWQESYGGLRWLKGAFSYSPAHLWRFEPGFWRRYLEGRSRWEAPAEIRSVPGAYSGWKRRISSSYGLCQIMYPTAVDEGIVSRDQEPEVLFDPVLNLNGGALLLRRWHDQLGNWPHVFRRYNGGHRGFDQYPARVRRYSASVEKKRAALEAARWGEG